MAPLDCVTTMILKDTLFVWYGYTKFKLMAIVVGAMPTIPVVSH